MLRWLRKDRSNGIKPEQIHTLCERRLEEILQSVERDQRTDGRVSIDWRHMMCRTVDLVKMWRRCFYPALDDALKSVGAVSQRIAIRKLLLDTIEHAAPHRAFLWTGISADRIRGGEESAVLKEVWDRETIDLEDATYTHVTYLTIADCSIEILRFIQASIHGLAESNENNYFEYFKELTTKIWYLTSQNNIAISKGSLDPFAPFIPALKAKLAQVRAEVMTGDDIHYESEATTTDENQEGIQNSPIDISAAQIEALTDILLMRLQRMIHGELYLIYAQPPSIGSSAFYFETAMMLAGLRECTAGLRECTNDDSVAEKAIRSIILGVQQKALRRDEQAKSVSDIDIAPQVMIADMKRDHEDEGWMPYAALVGAGLMHPELHAAESGFATRKACLG